MLYIYWKQFFNKEDFVIYLKITIIAFNIFTIHGRFQFCLISKQQGDFHREISMFPGSANPSVRAVLPGWPEARVLARNRQFSTFPLAKNVHVSCCVDLLSASVDIVPKPDSDQCLISFLSASQLSNLLNILWKKKKVKSVNKLLFE